MARVELLNRELSWLEFNLRVLQEASDTSVPLIERLRFLGIYSNNLDEFYRVRVATLKRMVRIRNKEIKQLQFNPAQVLKQVLETEKQNQNKFTYVFEHLIELLAREQIYLVNEQQLTDRQLQYVESYFREHVRSHLFPMMLANLKDQAILKDKSIYLAIDLKIKSDPGHNDYALIRVPTPPLSRFIVLPSENGTDSIILLDDVIRVGLKDIFSALGYDHFDAYTIKLTRDSELDLEGDLSRSFIEILTESLKQRKAGTPVRFIYDRKMPLALVYMLLKKLNLSKHDSISEGGRYHNFKDFMRFPDLGRNELCYPPCPPLAHPVLEAGQNIFDLLRQRDIMLHYPYQSFRHIIDLLRQASIDPNVRAIKMTLYRVAQFSNVINALINAVRNGKEVTVFLEVQARFDEEANLYWSEKLLEEGVKVIKAIPGIKVHCKLLLIRRKENNQNIYYANITTGNFNEQTARVYADDSLLTADQKIAGEVNRVFYLIESKTQTPEFKDLIVAPFGMRERFIRMLNREIRKARQGKEAWAIIKLNSLADQKIISHLYRASQAGVKLRLIVRGICMLVPGIGGLSDNIEVISIVDKYLEHSRVMVFCNAGKNKYYISSADWMVRNFDNRIEVACPIKAPVVQKQIRQMLEIQWRDNVKARIVNSGDQNVYRPKRHPVIRAQEEIYYYIRQQSS